jgi:hypothetical protein
LTLCRLAFWRIASFSFSLFSSNWLYIPCSFLPAEHVHTRHEGHLMYKSHSEKVIDRKQTRTQKHLCKNKASMIIVVNEKCKRQQKNNTQNTEWVKT